MTVNLISQISSPAGGAIEEWGQRKNRDFKKVISERLKNERDLFEKLVEKYKKSNSFDDETEIANDLSELIYLVQKTAFKAGVEAAVDVWNEVHNE